MKHTAGRDSAGKGAVRGGTGGRRAKEDRHSRSAEKERNGEFDTGEWKGTESESERREYRRMGTVRSGRCSGAAGTETAALQRGECETESGGCGERLESGLRSARQTKQGKNREEKEREEGEA